MNDSTEGKWLAQRAILAAEAQVGQLENLAVNRCLSIFSKNLSERVHSDPYCACFSTHGDVLSQWFRYADGGKGFAIGFNPFAFDFGFGPPRVVSYDDSLLDDFVQALLKTAVSVLRQASEAQSDEVASRVARELTEAITSKAVFFKNPGFSEEQEVRMVHDCVPSKEVLGEFMAELGIQRMAVPDRFPLLDRFHVAGSELKHYLAFPFDLSSTPSPIVDLVLGPLNSARSDSMALVKMLKAYGFEKIPIRESRIPLK